MLNRFLEKYTRKKIIAVVLLIFIGISSILFYLWQTSFKRAYEHGTMYEQLDALMNTKRYAKDVEKAGYSVDEYYLKMNGRITKIEVNSNPEITVSAPSKSISEISIQVRIYSNPEEQEDSQFVLINCNKHMEITQTSETLTKGEYADLLNLTKEKTREMLDKVYAHMYDN